MGLISKIEEQPVFKNISDERLLLELLRRNQAHPWPLRTERMTAGFQWTVGIGNDNVADITLSDDDLFQLIDRVQAEE